MVTIPWRLGVNMREFAYYDRPECLRFPQATPPTREAQVAALLNLKIPLVRFFAAHRNASIDLNLQQIGKALAILQQNRMQAIVCLGDSIFESGYTIPGNDSFHQMGTPLGHIHKSFFEPANYSKHYLPYVRRVVEQFADHPAVLAWELGNEFAIHPQPASVTDYNRFVEFVRVVSREIKQRSPKKLVTTGLINSNQVLPPGDDATRRSLARQLHSLPDVDVCSIHVYAEDDEDHLAMLDVDVAKTGLGKPIFVGELGADIERTANRPNFIRQQLRRWKDRGAFTVMLWQFDTSPHDSGVADRLAFGRRWPDFGAIEQVVREFIGAIDPYVGDVTPIPDGTTERADTRREETPADIVSGERGFAPVGERAAPFTLRYPMDWQYRIAANFDDPARYFHEPNKVQKREGIMFVPSAANQNLQVRAAQRGRVAEVKFYQQGYGRYVTIVHEWEGETFVTWYGHLASVSVRVGQTVSMGDVIGVAGKTGSASEVCLFFVVQHLTKGRKNYVVDDVVNPMDYLTEQVKVERNEAVWVDDVTFPDNTIVLCGQEFKKIWRIRNTGTTEWGEGYEFVFFSDVNLGTVASKPLPPAKPGEEVQVAVDMVAPAAPGIYRSTWKPRDPKGQFFPHEQWTIIDARQKPADTREPKLSFVGETIPDGTVLTPGQRFVKTWRVRNTGNTVWKGYTLRFQSHDRMSGPESTPLPELRVQQEGEVSLELIAPSTSGRHLSYWRPHDADGKPFDYYLFVDIQVRPANIPNQQPIFGSPITGSWVRGPLQFMTRINYGDGTHNGVDYVNCAGQAVTAGGVGTVYKVFRCNPCRGKSFLELGMNDQQRIDAFNNPNYVYGFGNLVIVRYPWEELPVNARAEMARKGFREFYAFVYYAHLTDDIRVTEGSAVAAGTVIGFVGNTGNSTGPHLHLEVRCYKSPTPQPLIANVDSVLIDPNFIVTF
jgi:murein DD-endopeptidase MepM/ murein hydrolase activator NlpD